MSSIDKGVEQVVNRLGRNVRVEKNGNTIYGIMNGEVVFSLADRYGYINSQEEAVIRNGIRRYDEAIQRARIEAERQRKEMLERERVAEYEKVRQKINAKRSQINAMIQKLESCGESMKKTNEKRAAELAAISSAYPLLDFSELEKENVEAVTAQKQLIQQRIAQGKEVLKNFERLAGSVSGTLATSRYHALNTEISAFRIPTITTGSIEYENNRFYEQTRDLQRALQSMAPILSRIEKYADGNEEIAVVAKSALQAIGNIKIQDAADVSTVVETMQRTLADIRVIMENETIRTDIEAISVIEGEIAACSETYDIIGVSTYRVLDFRNEIEEVAKDAIERFAELSNAEYSTCSKTRNGEATERLTEILERGASGEAVLREVEAFKSEACTYAIQDENHRAEHDEYRAIVSALKEYGVPDTKIEVFDVHAYAEQKTRLTGLLALEKRKFERSRLIVTDMQVKSVMQSMGYDLFSSIGDANGYIREALFTKRGYDGVLWQTVVLSDGSVTRRLIGVNKGETETDTAYVKQVAEQMEKAGEPQTFLQQFKETTGSQLSVNFACEHDSENAEAVIARNGYHYLRGQALELYNKNVAQEQEAARPTKAAEHVRRERKIVAGKAISSSAAALRAAEQKSRAMSHAN